MCFTKIISLCCLWEVSWISRVPLILMSRDSKTLGRGMLTRDNQWYQLGQDQDYPPPNFSANTANPTGLCYPAALFSPTCVTNEYVNVQADHFKVARNISREAITLLKNANNTLPLSTSAVLKIFGSDAENNPAGSNACSERVCIGLIYHVLLLSPPNLFHYSQYPWRNH